jgi:vacuolar-type H+-ATPase subunit D/Vma8
MTTEQELLNQISETEDELKHARLSLSDLKEKLTSTETYLIGLKLKKDKLQAQLQKTRNEAVSATEYETAYDADIERFRQRLPELLKKV